MACPIFYSRTENKLEETCNLEFYVQKIEKSGARDELKTDHRLAQMIEVIGNSLPIGDRKVTQLANCVKIISSVILFCRPFLLLQHKK